MRPVFFEDILAQSFFGNELGADGFSCKNGENIEFLSVFIHLLAVVKEYVQLLEEAHWVEKERNANFGVELTGEK